MKKPLLLYILVLILIPTFVVSIIYKSMNSSVNNETKKNKSANTETKINIKINKNNEVIEIDLEEYIIGVVAGEMPASFEMEALKAQAVASRTYAMYKIENNKKNYDIETTVDDQVYIDKSEMKEKWKSDYDYYYKKIKNAVSSTKNIVMKKDNKIFKSYYFAMSNGYTEDSETVFGETTINSVSSPWDNETLNKFKVEKDYSLKEIQSKLNIKETIKNIEILKRDNNDRVEKIKVNDITYTGIEFRKLLELRSTDFSIKIKEDICTITTKGYGHGVGMSQYGANGMAKENYTYDEILKYYYQDIKLEEI